MKPDFKPGNNIAMKVPAHEFAATVSFYRDVLGFNQKEALSSDSSQSVAFEFGDKNLWIDRTPGLSQAEIWLQVIARDSEQASDYLKTSGCVRCDEIEPLPDGYRGFWIAGPSNIIHLVSEAADFTD